MKTAHTRFIICSLLITLLIVGMISPVFGAVSSSDGYGSSGESYKGPYDLSKEHAVNLYYTDMDAITELQEIIYQEFLYWGMTHEGAAAVVGNIICESGLDPTRLQGNVSWSEFKWATTGAGLIQWTYFSLQADLFNTAYRMGRSWTDLSVQFEAMKHYFGPDDASSARLYESGRTLQELTDWFLEVKENPRVKNYETRRHCAQTTYDRCSGLTAKHYEDGSYDVAMSNAATGTTGSTDAEYIPEEVETETPSGEWNVMGMPQASGLSKSVINVSFPDAIKDYKLAHNIAIIGEDISSRNNLDTWKMARSAIVFVGMFLVIYAIFMICAVILDNVNNFIDISFVTLLSFGALKYTNDPTLMDKPKKYISTKRMIIVIAVLFAVGAFCISGGVFSYLLKAIYWVNESIGS